MRETETNRPGGGGKDERRLRDPCVPSMWATETGEAAEAFDMESQAAQPLGFFDCERHEHWHFYRSAGWMAAYLRGHRLRPLATSIKNPSEAMANVPMGGLKVGESSRTEAA